MKQITANMTVEHKKKAAASQVAAKAAKPRKTAPKSLRKSYVSLIT